MVENMLFRTRAVKGRSGKNFYAAQTWNNIEDRIVQIGWMRNGEYPHVWCGPITARATAHMAAVLPNLGLMEFAACSPDVTWGTTLSHRKIQFAV